MSSANICINSEALKTAKLLTEKENESLKMTTEPKNELPDEIWAHTKQHAFHGMRGGWFDYVPAEGEHVKYIRADLCAPTDELILEAKNWIECHESVSKDQAEKLGIKLTPTRLRIYQTIESSLTRPSREAQLLECIRDLTEHYDYGTPAMQEVLDKHAAIIEESQCQNQKP